MNFLLIFLAAFAAMIISRPLLQLVLSVVPVQSIQNDSVRVVSTAVLRGLVVTSAFAVMFALIGMGYGFANFCFVWAALSAIEYFMPSRPVA